MAFFGETDPHARHDMIREARNGGSVNAHFYGVLKRHVKSGRLDLRTLTEVESAHVDADAEGAAAKWTLRVRTRIDDKAQLALPGAPSSTLDTLADVDYIVCATGSALDLANVECVRPLLDSHPVELVKGLPRLTSDLQWREDVPFFVAGAYAMLEVRSVSLSLFPALGPLELSSGFQAHRLTLSFPLVALTLLHLVLLRHAARSRRPQPLRHAPRRRAHRAPPRGPRRL